MADPGNEFVNWYRVQDFPLMREELVQKASRAMGEGGYEQAMASVFLKEGERDLDKMALAASIEKMKEMNLSKSQAEYILRKLNNLRPEDPGSTSVP